MNKIIKINSSTRKTIGQDLFLIREKARSWKLCYFDNLFEQEILLGVFSYHNGISFLLAYYHQFS